MTPAPLKLQHDPVRLILAQNRAIVALTEKIGELERKIDALEALPRSMGGGLRKNVAEDLFVNVTGDTMTGNLDMGGNYLTNVVCVLPESDGVGYLGRWDTAQRFNHAGILNIKTNNIEGKNSSSIFKTYGNANYAWWFQSYDGSTQNCARLKAGMFDIFRGGDITMLDQKMMQFGTYTDAQRPAPGTAGRWIFNTDDGMPNYDDGTNWRDINGNIT